MSAVMLSTHDFRTSKHFGLTKMTPSLYMFSIYNILCTLSPISKCQSGPQSSDCQSDMTVWGVTLKCFWAEFRPNLHTVPKTTFWRGAAKNNRWVTALSPKAKKAKVYSKLLNGVGCAGLKSTRVKVHRKSTEPFKSLCLQCRLSLWIQHISFFWDNIGSYSTAMGSTGGINTEEKKKHQSCWQQCAALVFDQ